MSEPTTRYEVDMRQQPAALRDFANSALPADITALDLGRFDRIVLTGMGGSDCAAAPMELALARAGRPVWRMPAGRLLEMLALITPGTLLIVTSQSGRSGEVVALLERVPRAGRGLLIGITGDPTSPLGQAADHLVLLQCGEEATVATKSYVNTLAAFHRLIGTWCGGSDATAVADIRQAADSLEAFAAQDHAALDRLATEAMGSQRPRFALIGSDTDTTTVTAGAMVLKEAAKIAAEGYVAGAFRHGPLELAGPGLTALLFGTGAMGDASLHRLARDVAATGSLVVTVAAAPYGGSAHVAISTANDMERLVQGIYVVQRFSVALARATGIVPGAFNYGTKVTDLL